MTRACARPGCNEAAVATLTYDYATRFTWLDALAADVHPMSYDLCGSHAEALTVPRGWRLEDRRDPAPVTASPPTRLPLAPPHGSPPAVPRDVAGSPGH